MIYKHQKHINLKKIFLIFLKILLKHNAKQVLIDKLALFFYL